MELFSNQLKLHDLFDSLVEIVKELPLKVLEGSARDHELWRFLSHTADTPSELDGRSPPIEASATSEEVKMKI